MSSSPRSFFANPQRKVVISVSASHPEERVEGAVLHELGHDHDRVALGDDALEVDDVRVVELTHDGRLRQEVEAVLVRRSGLERLNSDAELRFSVQPQLSFADVSELTCNKIQGIQTVKTN